MIYKNYKGSVLVTVLMVTITSIITLSGLYVVLQGNISTTFSSINDSRLYYSAESGLNYALKWIKTLGANDFNTQTTDFNKTITDEFSIVTTITASPTEDPDTGGNIWSITSSSILDGRICTISSSNIKSFGAAENLFQYSFITNTCNNDLKSIYLGVGSTIIGKYHSKQNIKVYNGVNSSSSDADISETRFFGKVESSSSTISSELTATGFAADLFQTSTSFSEFSKGFNLNTELVDFNNETELRNELDTKIFPMGFNSQATENSYDDVYYNFDELLANPGDIKTFNLADAGIPVTNSVEIKFKQKWTEEADDFGNNFPIGSAIIVIKSKSNKRLHVLQGEYNVIAVPKQFNEVRVFGDVYNDITVATERSDVYIIGDLFSQEYAPYRTKSLNDYGLKDYDPQDKDLEINNMRAIDTDIEIAIMAGIGYDKAPKKNEGNIFVDNKASKTGLGQNGSSDSRYNRQAILIKAALFSPFGTLLAEGGNPDDIEDVGSIATNFSVSNDVILYGSFIGREGGRFYNTHTSASNGLRPHFIADTNLMNGAIPFGFKNTSSGGSSSVTTITNPATGDEEIVFTEEITWDINWEQ